MHEIFGIIAAILVVIAYIPYVGKIIKGTVKPHPFTWLIWTITATSIFLLQLSNGSGAGAYGTAAMAISAASVFIISSRKGMPKVSNLDIICLTIALLGVGVWLIVREPVISIALLLSVELIGFIPTVIKAWHKPYEESAALWGLTATRQSMGLFAIQHHNTVTLLNPSIWVTVSFSFFIFLFVRRSVKNKPKRRIRNVQPFSS